MTAFILEPELANLSLLKQVHVALRLHQLIVPLINLMSIPKGKLRNSGLQI